MKVIIAGGRDANKWDVYAAMDAAASAGFFDQHELTEIVSGMARGADSHGEDWASEYGYPTTLFPAKWHEHGKKAGHLRNIEMGDYADALIAVWDGKSKGTKHMIDYATKKGLKVYVHRY